MFCELGHLMKVLFCFSKSRITCMVSLLFFFFALLTMGESGKIVGNFF